MSHLPISSFSIRKVWVFPSSTNLLGKPMSTTFKFPTYSIPGEIRCPTFGTRK